MDECIEFKLMGGQITLIDREDVSKMEGYNWRIQTGKGGKIYVVGYPVGFWSQLILLHRFILNPPKHLDIDHRNGNGLDNRKSNLRICTRSQNLANQVRQSRSKTSSYKGVYLSKKDGVWVSKIKTNGHRIFLGRFNSEFFAALAYDKAAKEIFGEFARPNFAQITPGE